MPRRWLEIDWYIADCWLRHYVLSDIRKMTFFNRQCSNLISATNAAKFGAQPYWHPYKVVGFIKNESFHLLSYTWKHHEICIVYPPCLWNCSSWFRLLLKHLMMERWFRFPFGAIQSSTEAMLASIKSRHSYSSQTMALSDPSPPRLGKPPAVAAIYRLSKSSAYFRVASSLPPK